jgi:hypothetical protein
LRVVVNPHTAVDTWGVTFPAVVRHDPGVSAIGLVVPEGGEGPCRYVVGLVGPHDVRRCVASWGYPSERRTSSSGDVLVEILVVVVEIAGRLGDPGAAADGSIVRTVLARGPASASREGHAPRFVASCVELLVVVVGPIVLDAVALGPARAIWDGRTRHFVARSVERAFLGATAVGPLVYDGATLESIVVVIVLVELLLLRVEIARFRVLLGDGGGFVILGGAFSGRPPFDKPTVSVRSSGSPWGSPWGSSSPMGSVRPRSAVPFARSRQRRKVSSPRNFFQGDGPRGFFLGDPPAASASATPPSILAPRAGFRRVGTDPKLFETFGPLVALLPWFFSADVALANAPAAPSSPLCVRRNGLMREGVVGAMMIFYLIWLVPRRLLGEKVRSQGVLFVGFGKEHK